MSNFPNTLQIPEGEQFNIYNDGTSPRWQPGKVYATADGREFVFVKAGASDLLPGKLVQGVAPVTNHVGMTATAADATVNGLGSKSVKFTLGATAATLNQYKDGFLVVEDGTGAGQMYKILSHPAANLSTALVVTLYPEAGLQVALDATSKVSLLKREWDGAILAPTTLTNVVIGVPLVTITAAYYGWAQKKGVCPALQDGAWTVGAGLMASNGTAGSLEDASLSVATTPVAGAQVTGPIVGAAVRNVGTTKYGIARLAL